MIDSIDPKEAATIQDVIAEDLARPASEAARQRVVVRLLKQRRWTRRELPPGTRVRELVAGWGGEQPAPLRAKTFVDTRTTKVREYVTFAATFLLYDARRIVGELNQKRASNTTVRVSTIRALMHSVRIPEVHTGVEFEEEA